MPAALSYLIVSSRSILVALLLVFASTAHAEPPSAHARLQQLVKSRLLASLDVFLGQFADTRFGSVVRLGDRDALHRAFDHALEVVLDGHLDVQGRYESGETGDAGAPGVPGRPAIATLRVATSRPAPGDPTLWHEAMHHLVQRTEPQDCLAEEAYMEICERRIAWLTGVRAYERLIADRPEMTATERRRSWALREKQWRDQHLSGPFRWSNAGADRTCDDARSSITLDRATLEKLDRLIGFDVDLMRVKSIFFPPAKRGHTSF